MRAQYAGTCTAEDDPINPGDNVVKDRRGGYSHARCVEIDDEPDTDGRRPGRDNPFRGRRR